MVLNFVFERNRSDIHDLEACKYISCLNKNVAYTVQLGFKPNTNQFLCSFL